MVLGEMHLLSGKSENDGGKKIFFLASVAFKIALKVLQTLKESDDAPMRSVRSQRQVRAMS